MKDSKSDVSLPDELFFTTEELENIREGQAILDTIQFEEDEEPLSNDDTHANDLAESTPGSVFNTVSTVSVDDSKLEVSANSKRKTSEWFKTKEYDEFIVQEIRDFLLKWITQQPKENKITVVYITDHVYDAYISKFGEPSKSAAAMQLIKKKLNKKITSIVRGSLIAFGILAYAESATEYKLIETDKNKISSTVVMGKIYPRKRDGYYIQSNHSTEKHKRKNPDYIQTNSTQEASNDNGPSTTQGEDSVVEDLCTDEWDQYIADGVRDALIRRITYNLADKAFTAADFCRDILLHAEPDKKEKLDKVKKKLSNKIYPILKEKLLDIVTRAGKNGYKLIETDVEVIKAKVTKNSIFPRDRSYYHSRGKEKSKKHKKSAYNQSDFEQADVNDNNNNFSTVDMEMEEQQIINILVDLSQTTTTSAVENDSKQTLTPEAQEAIINNWNRKAHENSDSETDLCRTSTPSGPHFFHKYRTNNDSNDNNNNNNNTVQSEETKRQKINTQHFFSRAAESALKESNSITHSIIKKSKRV